MTRSRIAALLAALFLACAGAQAQDDSKKPEQPHPAPAAAPSPEPPSPADSTRLEIIKSPKAIYPLVAREQRLQGQVWISLLISETGDVESTEIISGNAVLAKAAEEAMRKWKFKPYIHNGKPAKVKTKMPYDFAVGGNVSEILTPDGAAGAAPSTAPTDSALSSQGSPGSNQNGTPKMVRVAQGVMEGLIVHMVNPAYPTEAKVNHIQGDVLLLATIGKDGRIHNLRAVSGHPVLVEASIGAVQQWRYRPYTLNGEPVEVETTIKVQFHM